MTTDPNQSVHNQLQLFESVNRRRATKSDKCAEYICTESEARTKPEIYDWVIREMPRSWRLELQAQACATDTGTGMKSAHRAQTIQGALLRQLHGLAIGHFSILTLPTSLIKGPTSAAGVFIDKDLNGDLAGETAIEKRLFNFAMKETARQYIEGLENWPSLDCPVKGNIPVDPWSENLWFCDRQILISSFEKWIQPLRSRQQSFAKA
ncbi:MAG: hypothetical protein J0L82_15105 [Deltaproteobacteria bacterium]|jgi:hypothetical protein|nr:hypothetical protein [Deltaproteobacteria bacterium]